MKKNTVFLNALAINLDELKAKIEDESLDIKTEIENTINISFMKEFIKSPLELRLLKDFSSLLVGKKDKHTIFKLINSINALLESREAPLMFDIEFLQHLDLEKKEISFSNSQSVSSIMSFLILHIVKTNHKKKYNKTYKNLDSISFDLDGDVDNTSGNGIDNYNSSINLKYQQINALMFEMGLDEVDDEEKALAKLMDLINSGSIDIERLKKLTQFNFPHIYQAILKQEKAMNQKRESFKTNNLTPGNSSDNDEKKKKGNYLTPTIGGSYP